MQNPYLPNLWFRTNFYLEDAFDGTRHIKVMEIVPAHNEKWTFTLLSAFLNEHPNFRKADRRAYEQETKNGTLQQRFIFQNRNWIYENSFENKSGKENILHLYRI